MNIDSMSTLSKYKIKIKGDDYFLVSDESEQHVNNVIAFVENQIDQVFKKNPEIDAKRVITLVALQIASKLLKANEQIENQKHQSEKLVNLINNELEFLEIR